MQKAAVSKAKVDDAKASWESGIDLYHLHLLLYIYIVLCFALSYLASVGFETPASFPHFSNLRIFVTSPAVRSP